MIDFDDAFWERIALTPVTLLTDVLLGPPATAFWEWLTARSGAGRSGGHAADNGEPGETVIGGLADWWAWLQDWAAENSSLLGWMSSCRSVRSCCACCCCR